MPWTSMLGLGLLTDNLDVKLFDFDFIFFLDIDQEPISKLSKTMTKFDHPETLRRLSLDGSSWWRYYPTI